MQQLSGLDASFLYLETANSPMHISGLSIYDPVSAPDGKVSFKQILAHVTDRAHKVAAMTNVLVEVPLMMDHPYWKSAGSIDSEFHVRHIALPKPGDWRQLCIQVSRLHARPLDRSRPLWEMYVIEGLDNLEAYPPGCFAVLTKMHHAAIDGASGIEISAVTHDLSPAVVSSETPHKSPERTPTSVELLWRAQINTLKQPKRLFDVAKNTLPGVAKVAANLVSGKLQRVREIPRTRFNTNVSPHRVFDAVQFELSAIKNIKNALPGVTVNDVALSICGGALRRYLQDKQELPEQSLAAMAPINVRTNDEKGTAGNQVSQMTVKLCSDIDDPIERLQAVNEGTQAAKQFSQAIGAKTMTDYAHFIPSTLTASAAKLSSRFGLANRGKPQFNCVVTNVPGPQVPLYFTGARMLTTFGLGPAIDGIGLFHAIGSYCGGFNIAFCSCREMLPDPAFYAECLQSSFDELYAASGALNVTDSKAQTTIKNRSTIADKTEINTANSTTNKRARRKKSKTKKVSTKTPVAKQASASAAKKPLQKIRRIKSL